MNYTFFENKKILIIVPHEDDEIHLAGNIISSLNNTLNIYVLFVTNGDFIYDAKYRFKEAIKSLNKLGKINKNNIIFLGYSDQPYDQNNHMYNNDSDWISNKNRNKTYSPKGYDEWNYSFNGEHALFNKNNIKNNIKEVINYIKPEIIICNDLDFHSDHIMTSLLFEKAIGELLIENKKYNPIILKGFTYENSYWGPVDFYDKQCKEMFFALDDYYNLLSNPYYNKNNMLKFNISKYCYTKMLFKNKIFKAILKHKSQNLISHASRMINVNQVYWYRTSNNLLRDATISVSSGDSTLLNDFMLCDTTNVLNGLKSPILYNKGIWIPDKNDNEKCITISFNDKKNINKIIIYNGLVNKNYIKNISIKVNGKEDKINLEDKYYNEIIINETTNEIIINILDKQCDNGFSEIEVLSNDINIINDINKDYTNINYETNKICNIFNKLIIKLLTIYQKIYRKIFIRK